MLRTLITVFILVRMRLYTGCQVPLLLCISILKQLYIVHARPFEVPSENRLALFNESLISIYIYGLILMTDYNNSEFLRLNTPWLLIGTIALFTLINIFIFFNAALALAWRSFIKQCRILKRKYFRTQINPAINFGEKSPPDSNIIDLGPKLLTITEIIALRNARLNAGNEHPDLIHIELGPNLLTINEIITIRNTRKNARVMMQNRDMIVEDIESTYEEPYQT